MSNRSSYSTGSDLISVLEMVSESDLHHITVKELILDLYGVWNRTEKLILNLY